MDSQQIKTTVIFTDGSGEDYTKGKDIHAGTGIFFGDGDPRNVSTPFVIYPITHNRAEIYGVIKTVEIMAAKIINTDPLQKLVIYSDSQYVVKSINEWMDGWKKKGWKKADKKPVENMDLWYWLDKLMQMYANRFQYEIHWMPSHENPPKAAKDSQEYIQWYGNMMADKFAKAGRDASRLLK